MKGSETKLVAFMQGSDKRFVIPVYQRNYDWKIENCKQLYDDLLRVIRMGRKSHFFGSIVSVHNPDGQFNEHLVIDGQQRLTTVSLLLLAMYNLLEQKKVIPKRSSLSERIYKEYLVDQWQEDETRIKLKPVKNDREAFGRLFEEEDGFVQDSNLTGNYKYFRDRIQKEEIGIDELFDAICRLEIISITLNANDDNPQLIFESLNSTGVALSEGDKIRNFILMGLPTKQQNEYYEKYWNKIEECTRYDVSMFVRDYLSVKQQLTPAMNRVYFTFKEYVEESKLETEALLAELLAYAKRYKTLLCGGTASKKINACIDRLNRLETTVTRPFFLEVLRMKDEGKLSIEQIGEIFQYTENYLIRRMICDLPTNVLNKAFVALHREIMRYDGTDADYFEKFKYALTSKRERARFPEDEEFITSFAERPVYQMNGKNKGYILERFENYGTIEDKDVYRHCDDGTYSIEHVMPQHLTPEWIRALGEDYEQIHNEWLHRIANLTLTAYNSKYSNSPFAEKRDMTNGFRDAGIRMNTWIAQKEKWTLAELEERNDLLMRRALDIWKYPASSYQPQERQLDFCTLDDDVNLSGRILAKFQYKNSEQPVTSWVEMFEQVLKMMHAEDYSVLTRLAYADPDSVDLAIHVRRKPEELRGALQIDKDLYVERNTSTWLKLSILRRLFKLYGADPSDLMFYFRDENTQEETNEARRHVLRRAYWTYALDHIKNANAENRCFSKVQPTIGSWESGFFGIGGFNISCVANYDSARVELVLSKSQKEPNKAAFDRLFGHKSEIESTLGVALEWLRSDETKGSYIRYKLEGVSITDESDWPRMAKFHAEWSRKFYDVFVPYLKHE